MKKTFLCLLMLNLAMLPCAADVIPTRYGDSSPAAKENVQANLVEQGLSTADAQTRADRLTSRELAFFAGNPGSVQTASGLYNYEWVLGGFVLVFVTFVAVSLHVERDDQVHN